MRLPFARPLAATALLCAAVPAVAQSVTPVSPPAPTTVTRPSPLEQLASNPFTPNYSITRHHEFTPEPLAKATDSPQVTVEVRVLTVSGKESRAAVAKLFKAKDKEKTAFLTTEELLAVLEKCVADPTTTVMQAPRITATVGEPATVSVCENQLFTTAVTTKVIDGQVVFVPQNEAVETGTKLTTTATPSADGKFVKLKLAPKLLCSQPSSKAAV